MAIQKNDILDANTIRSSTSCLLDVDARESVVVLGILCLFPITVVSFLTVFDFFFAVTAFIITPLIIAHNQNVLFTKEHRVMILLAVWTLVAFARHPTQLGGYITWSMYIMPCILLIVLPQLAFNNGKRLLERGIQLLTPLLAIQLIIVVFYLFLQKGNKFDLHLSANVYWARSNYIAAMLELPLIWLYDQLQRGKENKKLVSVFFAIGIGALVLTTSRAGIITFVVSIGLYNMLLWKKIPKLFIGLLVFLIAFALISKVQMRMFHLLDRSNIDRIYMWVQSVELIIKEPIFGYGPGNVNLNADIINQAHKMPGPHNLILEVLLHVGIVGFTFFTVLIVLLAKKAHSFHKRKNEPVFLVIIFASMMHSMVEPTFFGAAYSFIFWYFMSILLVRYNEEVTLQGA